MLCLQERQALSCLAAFLTLSPFAFRNLSTQAVLQNFSCKTKKKKEKKKRHSPLKKWLAGKTREQNANFLKTHEAKHGDLKVGEEAQPVWLKVGLVFVEAEEQLQPLRRLCSADLSAADDDLSFPFRERFPTNGDEIKSTN